MFVSPQQQESIQVSESEYLAFETTRELKHEFVNGEVFAMTGESVRHNLICNNTSTALINQLVDEPCIVPSNDTRVKVESHVSYRYSDVTVICGEVAYVDGRTDTISNPIIVIEVLSPSTALLDRNQQLDEYTQIPTLQEYVLISQDAHKIERFLRQESGDWLYTKVTRDDGVLKLSSIDCELKVADVYRKLDLIGDIS